MNLISLILFLNIFLMGSYNFAYTFNFVKSNKQSFKIDSKQTPQTISDTFSDLIIFPDLHPTTEFKVSLKFKVIQQYRKNPKPWESFWLFWSYNKDANQNKFTNYIAFKTNGIEVGKAFNDVDQEFLYTDSQFPILINTWNQIVIESHLGNLKIQINQQNLRIQKNQLIGIYQYPGRIGFYVEDAKVLVKNFQLSYN